MLQYRTFFKGVFYSTAIIVVSFLLAVSCLYYLSNRTVNYCKSIRIVYEQNTNLPRLFVESGVTEYYTVAQFALSFMNFKGYTPKYGEYKIPKKCSLFDIIKRIALHDIIIHNIIVFRGWNVKDIKENINSRSDLSGEITEHISEGEILSGKYEFVHPTSKDDLLIEMKLISNKKIQKIWAQRSAKCPVATMNDAVILASIVATESMTDEDIPLVAGVFKNRLKRGMPLQSDPTVSYALRNDADYKEYTFRQFIKLKNNPYNSYRYKGLPPTPIASPSEADLKAVVNPIDVSYLFFIGDKINKKMHFTSDFNEHLKLQREFYKKYELYKKQKAD